MPPPAPTFPPCPAHALPGEQLNEPRGAAGLPEIRQAYEFTLDRLGQDSASGGVWLDYLAFLGAPKQGSPEYAAVYGEAHEGQVRCWGGALLMWSFARADGELCVR